MTNSEAINFLKGYLDEEVYTEKCRNAHKMAIEALEQENSGGCCGCAFEDVEEWKMPCSKCKRGCKDYWRPKKRN